MLVLTLQLPVAPVPVQVLFLLQEQVLLLLVRLECIQVYTCWTIKLSKASWIIQLAIYTSFEHFKDSFQLHR